MRVPLTARGLLLGTAAGGTVVLAAAAVKGAGTPLGTLALLGAAVLITELIEVTGDDSSLDPLEQGQSFSFSSGIHLASVVIVGPWAAALVAAFGVLAADGVRRAPLSRLAYNASVFSLAAVSGGALFQALGGTPGSLHLPADFPALVALGAAAYLVNTVFVGAIIAASSQTSVAPVLREKLRGELASATGEAALGIALAFFALTEPWAIAVLVPLVVALYQAQARLAALRRETARALETFANVVDERDPSTYRHSARVAEHVQALAEGLRLPASDVARLRWAGRLHDLGKIAVDAAVLRKPARLDDEEWTAMRLHPRLSARLLRRFRFAAEEARAVEFHHERVDGRGYYGVDEAEIPLAAHFLTLADSYDAMVSDRPYRPGMASEEALREIEANIGSQFHPALAKAFVALKGGRDAAAALTPAERGAIARAGVFGPGRPLAERARPAPEHVAAAGIVGALFAVAAGRPLLAAPALLASLAAVVVRRVAEYRARRLATALRRLLGAGARRDVVFSHVAAALARECELRWAGLLSWREPELCGSVELEWGAASRRPSDAALTSWLVRDAEAASGPLRAEGFELGREGVHVAVPLRRDGGLAGYLVLAIAGRLPGAVDGGLRRCAEEIAGGLLPSPVVPLRSLPAAASA